MNSSKLGIKIKNNDIVRLEGHINKAEEFINSEINKVKSDIAVIDEKKISNKLKKYIRSVVK